MITALWGTAAVLASQETLAQQQPSQQLQRVEVTGSNIRRADSETAAPVQVITRDEIDRSGKATVAQFLQTLAVDNQGSVPVTFGNGFASSASGISLRGLGAASTLVLINGRRVAPFGMADDGQKVFTDLNVIPLEAVERVEVLKDGASAIYGSDAIAGVVNIILRKNFQGTVAKASVGQSRYGDGTESRVALTHGFGDREGQGVNMLFNLELGQRNAIWNRDRAGKRDWVGKSDLRQYGFDAESSGGANGGTGAIISDRGAAVSSVVGNVRNPSTLEYWSRSSTAAGNDFTRTFPGACAAVAGGYPQGDPLGGCLIDASAQYGQVQPKDRNVNVFVRGSKQLDANNEVFAELNFYHDQSSTSGTPSGVHSSTGYPGGPVVNSNVQLGASHPDNPYFGRAARLRYLAWDVGPRTQDITTDFVRLLVGAKGTFGAWDYDTGLLFSQNKNDSTRTGYLQRDVTFALLNPANSSAVASATANSAAYRALPAGTVWRIGENAHLNSAAVYAALSPEIGSGARSQTTQLDFKASRELGSLAGGPIGLAVGAELRRESVKLDPVSGTERGNIIGLGYSAYDGARTVGAVYAEGNFPVTKTLELNAALRGDHYSDSGSSVTPKLGAKWRPADVVALRATYAQGFRAPNPAENGKGGLAAFSTAIDPARCALGVTSACSAGNVAIITSPNPSLKPEKSTSTSLGVVWDITPKTSLTADLWQIKRKNEINQETTQEAIAAGSIVRDPGGALSTVPGDPGPLVAVLAKYVNSATTTVNGIDLDFKHRMDFGASGRVTGNVAWTHLFKWRRVEQDGTVLDYAGTHGNCDVTNCMGTPRDRISASLTWEAGPWSVTGVANYRSGFKNVFFQDDPSGCATVYANGSDAPAGCRIASFTTVDLTARYKISQKTEIFGGIRNLFDRVPPLDPTTYGATSYNPLDYSGAVGRFFSIGVRHQL